MRWTNAMARWPNLLVHLCARFPHLDPTALARCRGDRHTIGLYLAETYDLTQAEAAQTLDDWITFTAMRQPHQSAA